MAQLTFPIATAELLVDVRVNLDASSLLEIRSAGRSAPTSVAARAFLDTGSDVTVIAPDILTQLGLLPSYYTTTHGISGLIQVGIYRVSLNVLDPNQPHILGFMQPDLLVMEMPSPLPVDVIIGMDVLLGCRMLLDGPAGVFSLDY